MQYDSSMTGLPIPFIDVGQMVILYQNVPEEIQGRIFVIYSVYNFQFNGEQKII